MVAKASYEIGFDRTRNLLSVTMKGLWDNSTVEAYRVDLVREVSQLRQGGRFPLEIGALVDLREQAILPRETAEAMQSVTETEWPAGNPAAVIISPSMIQKSQSGRMSARLRNIAFFTDKEEALAWLDTQPHR